MQPVLLLRGRSGLCPLFIKFSSYFPYIARIYLNGHEYAKRQLEKAGIAFEALDNGIRRCRDYEIFPLVCTRCGGEVEIISFITEAPTVRAILTRIGEPSEAPPISPRRGPPEWEMLDQPAEFDPVHPEPEYDFDQSVSW